jgi:carboxyl-terminal processing protease
MKGEVVMNSSIRGLLLIFIVSISLPAYAENDAEQKPLFPVQLDHEFPNAEETFDEVKKLILENYYSDDISEEALYWAAIKGMLRHISPPENRELATIWTPEEYDKILNSLKGRQVALGFKSSFNANDGSLTVTEVLPGSPSENVLKEHDRILKVNSNILKGLSLKELNSLLDGDEGEEVLLTVNRGLEIFDLNIKRKKFENENIIVTRLPYSIAIVELRKFTTDAPQRLKDELLKLQKDNFRGLVLDLRNNQGGVFMEALKIVEFFLPEKHILLRTFDREKKMQNYVSTNPDPLQFETVVLVNEKSASSAEILATSLQDHKRAIIVGTTTYGKGVFEKTYTTENDHRVKFITGMMYSPRGKPWQGKGIIPDFLVKQDQKTLDNLVKMEMKDRLQRDTGLITAVKLLKLEASEKQIENTRAE